MTRVIMMNSRTAQTIQKHDGVVVPPSVYVTLGGGLGDVYYVYHKGENGWGHIKSLKETFPHVEVKALCSTHNPQTVEFIKHNPYIDEYNEYGWVNDARQVWEKNSNGSVRLDKQHRLLKALNFSRPKVYATEDDNNLIKEIEAAGKFVLIHPFAGEPNRISIPIDEYIPLIDFIIDEIGTNVVVIGGDYTRVNMHMSETKGEDFSYKRDGLYNLVNKCNARTCMMLAAKQSHFIGNWSAYSCASWLNKKQTTILVQRKLKAKLEHKLSKGQRWHAAKCNIVVTQGPSHRPEGTDFDKVRREVLKSITR